MEGGKKFVSMEKHACFKSINKNGLTYSGPATCVKLIWWPDTTSFLHVDVPAAGPQQLSLWVLALPFHPREVGT